MDTNDISPKNVLNELSGGRWLYFTRSVLITTYPSEYGHQLRKAHGANKPPQLMRELIEFFTRSGGRVLDPFAGVGGTLLGASICERPREALGIEINPKWIEIYHNVLAAHRELRPQTLLQGDCLQVMETLEEGSFDLVATDPPYNIHFEQTMSNGHYAQGHANRRTDYDMRSTDPRDLANLASYEAYLEAMERVFAACYRLLKPRKYLVLIVRNAYQQGEYMFTHVDLARRAKLHGFVPKGEIVWYQVGTRLRPYGYPSAFVPNIAHQYILVLQKPKLASVKKKTIERGS